MARALTTGQVAKLCSVAPRTVSKWTDSGLLDSWRIPGSMDRRIPAMALYTFMQTHGMPLEKLEAELFTNVLVLSTFDKKAESIAACIGALKYFNVRTASTSFAAGLLISQRMPNIIVTDGGINMNGNLKDVLKLDMDDPDLITLLPNFRKRNYDG